MPMASPSAAGAVALTLALSGTAPVQELRDAALHVIVEDLSKSGSSFSRDMLARIATASGLEEEEAVRSGLRELLDTLDDHRRGRTEVWRALTAVGGEDVEEKKMDRLLRELIGWGRKATQGTGNYGLRLVVRRSAEKARVPTHRALDLLAAVAGLGLTGRVAPAARLPDDLGILVTGRSEYRVDSSRFVGMLRTEEDVNHQTRFRDIHLALVTGLVTALLDVEGVRWAIDEPHPRLAPDCVLQVDVTDFFSRQVRRDVTLYATVRISLSTAVGVRLYSKDLELAYDFWLEHDEIVRNQRRLDNFLLKLTRDIRDEVGRFLKTRTSG